MTLKLEDGKFYRLRNGEKAGPLIIDREHCLAEAPEDPHRFAMWYTEGNIHCSIPGRCDSKEEMPEDIVAEWSRTVIVYTPKGYQVTGTAVSKLMEHFGCETRIRGWRKDDPVTPGALHITDQECKRGMIVADANTGKPIEDFFVMSIYEALVAADPKIGHLFSEERQVVANPKTETVEEHQENFARSALNDLIDTCHDASYAAGWWHHPDTGLPYIPGDNRIVRPNVPQAWESLPMNYRDMIIHYWPFVVATKIGLFHSEVSEGFEAYRRGLRDDKLAHRLGLETEIADTMIRQFDLAGAFKRANALGVVDASTHEMDLSASFFEKISFNKDRPDHKVAARRAAGGKMF